MRRRIRLLPVMIVLACLAVAFFWFGSRLDAKLEEADQLYQQAVASGSALETTQNDLKATLETASSDAFIENQARSLYDYMKPDEIRIVITNPEALYGTDGE
jgi:cell division protein FtsB